VTATPKNVIGLLAIPIQLGLISARNFGGRFANTIDSQARPHGGERIKAG